MKRLSWFFATNTRLFFFLKILNGRAPHTVWWPCGNITMFPSDFNISDQIHYSTGTWIRRSKYYVKSFEKAIHTTQPKAGKTEQIRCCRLIVVITDTTREARIPKSAGACNEICKIVNTERAQFLVLLNGRSSVVCPGDGSSKLPLGSYMRGESAWNEWVSI